MPIGSNYRGPSVQERQDQAAADAANEDLYQRYGLMSHIETGELGRPPEAYDPVRTPYHREGDRGPTYIPATKMAGVLRVTENPSPSPFGRAVDDHLYGRLLQRLQDYQDEQASERSWFGKPQTY